MKKPSMNEEVRAYIQSVASAGGKARARKLSAAERKVIAKKAAQARWGKGGKK